MSDRLVRLALLLYPAGWRKRYGAELEQLIRDSLEHDSSAFGSVRVIVDVARGGLSQRIGHRRRRLRAALLVSLGVGIVFPIDVVTISGNPSPGSPPSMSRPLVTLSPTTRLAPGVSVYRFPQVMLPLMRSAEPPTVQLEVVAHTNYVYSVDGPPTHVVLNPRTGHLVSVTPIKRLATH